MNSLKFRSLSEVSRKIPLEEDKQFYNSIKSTPITYAENSNLGFYTNINKKKKRVFSYRYSNQADLKLYLKEKNKELYDSVDMVNYFHLWMMELGAPFHYPHYRSECRFAKLLIKAYNVEKVISIIKSYFVNRKEFETSNYKVNDPAKCSFRVLNLSSNKKVIYKCLQKIQ